MKIVIENADENDFNELAQLARIGRIHTFYMTDEDEGSQVKIKKYKPLEPDYNVQCAVENLKTAYWSNDSRKMAMVFVEAEEIIMSAICHHGYTVCKQTSEDNDGGNNNEQDSNN